MHMFMCVCVYPYRGPEIGMFPSWTYNESESAARGIRRDTPVKEVGGRSESATDGDRQVLRKIQRQKRLCCCGEMRKTDMQIVRIVIFFLLVRGFSLVV